MTVFAPGSYVVVYLRHSPGDQQTITSQENAVNTWCQDRHLIIVRMYKDEARTGTTTAGRNEFLTMVDALQDGLVLPRPAGIVLWSFSRFARDYDDAQYYCAVLRRHGYDIQSMTDQIPEGEIGRIVESLHHWANAETSRRIGKDAKRGLQQLAQGKFWHGARPPRGYALGEPVHIETRKNGTERIGHHLVFDPEWEPRVRRAWEMKLEGERNWRIHNELKIYPAINTYSTFFANLTYAGILKCGDLRILDAHPAYVALADWESVQKSRRLTPGNPQAENGDPDHSKRAQSPFLLSGLFYCGLCGHVMSGQRYHGVRTYRCGRRQRHGSDACSNPSIVAWHVEDFVQDWIAGNVFTAEQLARHRDDINRRIGCDRTLLESRLAQLEHDLAAVDRRAKNLLDSIERLGLSPELEQRIRERQLERRHMEREHAEIEAQLQQERVELTDGALEALAVRMREELEEEEPEEVRRLLKQVILRAELAQNEMTLYYVSPLVERPKTLSNPVPPWDVRLIEGLSPIVQVAHAALDPAPTGRASPQYHPFWVGSDLAESLPPMQRRILEAVRDAGTVTAGALAQKLGISHANAATVLRTLLELGLLEREPVLTPSGLFYAWSIR